jgi:Questin oxidase-like
MLQAWLPRLSLFHQTQLLRSHLATTLAWYCSRGRPALHPVVLDRYQTKLKINTANPWAHVVDATIQNEDVHVCKVIRSLIQADALWGSEPLQFPGYGVIHKPYLHAAEMTLETIRNGVDTWDKDAIGWDEGWREDKDQAHAPMAPSEGVKGQLLHLVGQH